MEGDGIHTLNHSEALQEAGVQVGCRVQPQKNEKDLHTVQSPAASRPCLFPTGDESIILEKIDVQTADMGI